MNIINDDIRRMYNDILTSNLKDKSNNYTIEEDNTNNNIVVYSKKGINVNCGDEITIYIKVDKKENKIIDISYTGTGCAISKAASNIICKNIKKEDNNIRDLKDAREYINNFLVTIKENDKTKEYELVKKYNFKEETALFGSKYLPSRIKCATLTWYTLNELLDEMNNETMEEI